jgi:hypothetical protein
LIVGLALLGLKVKMQRGLPVALLLMNLAGAVQQSLQCSQEMIAVLQISADLCWFLFQGDFFLRETVVYLVRPVWAKVMAKTMMKTMAKAMGKTMVRTMVKTKEKEQQED